MLDWLRNLIGNPPPVTTHIHIDKGCISIARAGDVVVISCDRRLKPEERESFDKWRESDAARLYPGIGFFVVEAPGVATVRSGAE